VREKQRRTAVAESERDAETRRRHDASRASRYFAGLPEQRKAALFAKWRATGQRDYELTLQAADRRGAPWAEDDDRHILATMKAPGREVALALGRTLWSVYARRGKLRRDIAALRGTAGPAEVARRYGVPPAVIDRVWRAEV
jgi:hypothetical protein